MNTPCLFLFKWCSQELATFAVWIEINPVLDRRPGSNNLKLHFRWVCAVQSHVREWIIEWSSLWSWSPDVSGHQVERLDYSFLFLLCTRHGMQDSTDLTESIGIFESPKCDVNPQPNTRGIGPLVGRTSGYRHSVMHVLAEISSITHHFSLICQNIFIWVIWCGREICPLLMYPSKFFIF